MIADVHALASAAADLQNRASLEGVLSLVGERAATFLGVGRAGIHLIGEPRQKDARVSWVIAHARPLRADGDGSFVGVPMLSARNVIGALSARDPRPGYFTSEHEDWLTLWAALAAPHVEVARLARLSHVDALTGALNRHGLEAALSELAPAYCVALVDIDHFKRVNDRHGHAVGDEVLRRVAQLLMSSLRATDVVVRWGGEEFLVLLPGVPLEQAHVALERARLCLASTAVHPEVRVTVSSGVAERHAREGHKDVIARADAALYQAKRGGRNTVRRA